MLVSILGGMGGGIKARGDLTSEGDIEPRVMWGDKGGGSKNWNFGVTSFMDDP